ncbi:MAG: hypothetical protein ACI934_001416, partial [Pseudohongiellaceae bacterium]
HKVYEHSARFPKRDVAQAVKPMGRRVNIK